MDSEHRKISYKNKQFFYQELISEMKALLDPDAFANLANASALLYHNLPDINWSGFYLLKKGELVLGPFQGKTACTRIALNRGVCGAAATQKKQCWWLTFSYFQDTLPAMALLDLKL